jgi:hypothetical protein
LAALAKTQRLPAVAIPEGTGSDTTLRSRLTAWTAIRNVLRD